MQREQRGRGGQKERGRRQGKQTVKTEGEKATRRQGKWGSSEQAEEWAGARARGTKTRAIGHARMPRRRGGGGREMGEACVRTQREQKESRKKNQHFHKTKRTIGCMAGVNVPDALGKDGTNRHNNSGATGRQRKKTTAE